MITDTELLEAALIGLQRRGSDIDEKIADLRRQLGIRGGAAKTSVGAAAVLGRKRRRMSAAGRRRIAEAQRKRWAALRKGSAAKPAPVKSRRISAAGRKRIIEATKKRWAEFHAKKAAATPAKVAAKRAAVKKSA